jgi:hypothetical protein
MSVRSLVTAVVVVVAASCTSTTSPTGLVTVTTAGLIGPANGAFIPNVSQPVTLTVANAVITSDPSTVTYTFEVATDTLFANKILTQIVPQGAGGRTSLTLGSLPPGKNYFWHVRATGAPATGAGTTGLFSAPLAFTIGPAIIIGAPTPITPLNGTTVNGSWPLLVVTNAPRTGPAGSMSYQFDIATSAAFTTIIVTATVQETPGQTSFTPPRQSLPTQTSILFWRATATDQTNSVSGPASTVLSFTVTPLWPGAQPPGTNGKAVLGDNWQVQTMTSFTGVVFVSPTLEELQVFDLIDRGFDPQGAISWLLANGYPTTAAFFPAVQVIGFPFEYMALINGRWDLVRRIGG